MSSRAATTRASTSPSPASAPAPLSPAPSALRSRSSAHSHSLRDRLSNCTSWARSHPHESLAFGLGAAAYTLSRTSRVSSTFGGTALHTLWTGLRTALTHGTALATGGVMGAIWGARYGHRMTQADNRARAESCASSGQGGVAETETDARATLHGEVCTAQEQEGPADGDAPPAYTREPE